MWSLDKEYQYDDNIVRAVILNQCLFMKSTQEK